MHKAYLVCAFDMLNVRDLDLIAQAGRLCDHLTVGVMSDDDTLAATGRMPVIPAAERLTLVQHLRGVDEAIAHREAEFDARPEGELLITIAGESDWLRPDADVVLEPAVDTRSTGVRRALMRVGA